VPLGNVYGGVASNKGGTDEGGTGTGAESKGGADSVDASIGEAIARRSSAVQSMGEGE
jgi:hypothetical protein